MTSTAEFGILCKQDSIPPRTLCATKLEPSPAQTFGRQDDVTGSLGSLCSGARTRASNIATLFRQRAACIASHEPRQPRQAQAAVRVAPAMSSAQRFSKALRTKDAMSLSTSRVYADVNTQRPKDYWDYENMNIQWG